MKPIIYGMLFLLSACNANPEEQGASPTAIDQIFAKWNQPNSPGCALAVIRDGEIIYSKGYGQADLEHNIPITPESVFYVGSVSKQFVTMCMLLLEEQGKLSIDDEVQMYVPELPDYGQPIRIRHLIHHTSGLRDNLTLWELTGRSMIDDIPEQAALALICRQKKLNFSPGGQYAYSNSGYFLLSVIIERVSGKPLSEFARENILTPLGMEHSVFNDDNHNIIENRAFAYTELENGQIGNMLMRFDLVGSGGLYSSVNDLLYWDRNFYDNQLGRGGQGLIEKMYQKGKLNNGKELDYAFALNMSNYRGVPLVYHTGTMGGYRAVYLRFPAQKFSVIILGNLAQLQPLNLAYQVADIYLKDQLAPNQETTLRANPKKSPFTEAVEMPAFNPNEYVGEYFSKELATAYEIVADDSVLQVSIFGEPFQTIKPVEPDRFETPYHTFQFQRNAQNTIDGFILDAGGVNGLVFKKTSKFP